MLRETKKNFLIDLAFFVTVAALIFIAIRFLAIYMLPFVIGLAITFLVQKPANQLSQRLKMKKGVCAVIMVILSYAVVSAIFAILGFGIYALAGKVVQFIPGIISYVTEELIPSINSLLSGFAHTPDVLNEAISSFGDGMLEKFGGYIGETIPKFAVNIVVATPEFIITVIVTVVASCYIAKDYDKFKRKIKLFLKPKYIEAINDLRDVFVQNIFKLFRSYAIIMAITFVELSVGFFVLRIENPLLIALLIAIVDILPILGCGTVLIPWGIIALIQGNIFLGIGLLVLYIVILIIRNFAEPKIIGKDVGLHPLITLLAIFVGLRLFGFIGVILLPIAIIVAYKLFAKHKDMFFKEEKTE